MPARRLLLHLLSASLTLLFGLAGPALADSCGAPASASTSGITTIGMQGMAFTVEQTAFLERVSGGAGYDGDWVVTEWSTLTTLPMADPLFAQRGGMLAVPDWDATCTGKSISATQVEGKCVGKTPLFVENGKISWVRGGKPIGKITPAKGPEPAEMSLSLLPNEGGVTWTMMTGAVTPSQSPNLTGQLTASRNISDPTLGIVGRAFTLQVVVEPALTKYVNAIDALVSDDGSGMPVAGISAAGSTVLGRTFVLTVSGASTYSRKTTIKASTIEATMESGGCNVAASWPLAALITAAGYAP